METPAVRKLRAGKVLTQGHPKSLVTTTPGDRPQSPGLTRSFPGSKAFRGFPPPLGQSCVSLPICQVGKHGGPEVQAVESAKRKFRAQLCAHVI